MGVGRVGRRPPPSNMVTDDKLEHVLSRHPDVLMRPYATITIHDLLSVAGRIMSARLLVQTAPLAAACIYKSLTSGAIDPDAE